MKYLILIFLFIFLLFICFIGGVSAYTPQQCNVLFGYDSMIPTYISWLNKSDSLDFVHNNIGSFDLDFWLNGNNSIFGGKYLRQQEVVSSIFSRYLINASSCYGYNDIYYLNSTLYLGFLEGLKYSARGQSSNGYFGGSSGGLTNEYLSQAIYNINKTNSSILQTTFNISIFQDFGNNKDLSSTNIIYLSDNTRWSLNFSNYSSRNWRNKMNNTVTFSYINVPYSNYSNFIFLGGYPNSSNISIYNYSIQISYNCSQSHALIEYQNGLEFDYNFVCNNTWNIQTFNYYANNSQLNAQNNIDLSIDSNGNFSLDWINWTILNIPVKDFLFNSMYRQLNGYILNYNQHNYYGYGGKFYSSNQEIGTTKFCYYMWKLTNNQSFFNCYNVSLYSIINNMSDGVYEEWSEPIACSNAFTNATLNCGNNPLAQYKYGYSSNYQLSTMPDMADLYNLTQDPIIESKLNDSINFISYMLLPYNNSLDLEGSLSTRSYDVFGILRKDRTMGNSPNLYTFKSFFSYIKNPYSNRIMYFVNNSFINFYNLSNLWSNYTFFNGYASQGIVDLFNNWNVQPPTVYLPNELNSPDYYKNFNGTKIFINRVNNRTFYLSYGWATPTGGVITDIYDLKNEQHIFSANGAGSNSESQYGVGLLKQYYGNVNPANETTNAWDGFSTLNILNSSYPIKVFINGSLKFVNQSNMGTTFNTTYTFFNDGIYVDQESSSNVEWQSWYLNKSTINNFNSIPSIINLDNIQIFPLNFNISYYKTQMDATWGYVDKLNASGNSFKYYIFFNPYILSEPRISQSGYYEGEPFNLTGDNRTKYIKSDIHNSINIPVDFTVDNCSIPSISYTSYGSVSHTYLNNTDFNCTNNSGLYTVYLNALDIQGTYLSSSSTSPIGNSFTLIFSLRPNSNKTVYYLEFASNRTSVTQKNYASVGEINTTPEVTLLEYAIDMMERSANGHMAQSVKSVFGMNELPVHSNNSFFYTVFRIEEPTDGNVVGVYLNMTRILLNSGNHDGFNNQSLSLYQSDIFGYTIPFNSSQNDIPFNVA